MIVSAVCFYTTTTTMAATVASDSSHQIDLDNDATGTSSMDPVDLSNKAVVRYSSDSGAGGYSLGANNQWAVVSASTGATAAIALQFCMRGSQNNEDNQVYQDLVGAIPSVTNIADPGALNPTSAVGWVVRGDS